MKKSFIATGMLFINSFVFSQKIEYKDNILKIDGKEAAYVEGKNQEYQFKNNSTSPVQMIVLLYDFKLKPEDNNTQFLKISNADKSISVDVKPVKIKVFKPALAMMEDMVVQYKLIDANGINTTNLNKFLTDNKDNIPEEFIALSKLKKRDSLVNLNKLTLLPDMTIEDKNKQKVGRIEHGQGKFDFTVYDLDNNKVSVFFANESSGLMELKLYPNLSNVYPLIGYSKGFGSSNVNQNTLYRFALEELSLNNYELGHAINEKKSIEKNNKIIEARKNSTNLYDVDGYYITEDKNKIVGKITFVGEDLPEEAQPQGGSIMSLSSYSGKSATIKYINEKGKEKTETIKASNNDSFVVIQDGKEIKYYGMKPKSSSTILDKATFFIVENQYGNDKAIIYKCPSNNSIAFKSTKQNYGLVINDRKNEKTSQLMAEYLADCPALSAELKANKYNFLKKEDIKQIVDSYNACK